MIPNPLRIDDSNRSMKADAQAIHFGAQNDSLRDIAWQLLQTLLQIFPRFQAGGPGRTLRLRLIGAQEYVTLKSIQSECTADLRRINGHD